MRARKRNPWLGQGLDKRQARRARRRTERRVARVEALMDAHAPSFKLMPWQKDVLRATQGRPFRSVVLAHPKRAGRSLTADLVRLLDEERRPESRPFMLDEWVSEGES